MKRGHFLLSTLSLGLIGIAVRAWGETNLPPLLPAVRFCILALYANWFLSFILFVSDDQIEMETLSRWKVMLPIGAVLSLVPPVFSGDLMEYLIRGRILAIYHASPYLAIPNDYPNDLLRSYSSWAHNPDSYGPLSVYIQTIPALLFRSSILGMIWAYKMIVLGFWAAAVVFFWKIVQALKWRSGVRAWALFAYCPLMGITALIDGHNDVIMMSLSVVSVYFLLTRRFGRAFLFWTLAFLVKYMVVIQLPFMVIWAVLTKRKESGKIPWRFLGVQTLLQIALIVIFFAPIWGGTGTFLAILRQKGAFYTNTIPYLFYWAADKIHLPLSQEFLKTFFLGGCVVFNFYLMVRCSQAGIESHRALIRMMAAAYLAFYACLPSPMGYWYLCWALPWIVLSEWPATPALVVIYSAVAACAFFKRINFLTVLGCLAYAVALWRSWQTARPARQ